MQRGKETEQQRFERKKAEEAKVLAECLPGWKKEVKFVIGVTNPITDLRIRVVELAMEEHIAWKVMNCVKTALKDLPREPVIHPYLAGNILFNLNAVFKISYERGPWFVMVGTNFNIAISLKCTEFMQAAVGGDLRILVYNVPYPKDGVETRPKSPALKTVTTKKTRTGVAKTPSTEHMSKSPNQSKNPRSKRAKSRSKSPKGKTAKSPAPKSPQRK